MFELFVPKHKTLHIHEIGDRNILELQICCIVFISLKQDTWRMHRNWNIKLQNWIRTFYQYKLDCSYKEMLGVWSLQLEQAQYFAQWETPTIALDQRRKEKNRKWKNPKINMQLPSVHLENFHLSLQTPLQSLLSNWKSNPHLHLPP